MVSLSRLRACLTVGASVFTWVDLRVAWVIVGCSAHLALAGQAPPFPELVREAERSSPRLVELEANVSAAQGHARQSAAWPNPVVSVEVEDFAGASPYRGSSHAQTTASLSEPLELGGQRAARIAEGRARLGSAQAQRTQLRAEFGYQLALAYAEAEVAQAQIDLLTEDSNRAQEDVRSARALVRAGKEGELRAVQAEAAASAAIAELESARAEGVGALAHLSSLVGVAEPYTSVGPSLLSASQPINLATQSIALTEIPAIASAEAERELADRRLTIERKRAIPTPSISVGTRRIAGDDATVWVAGISMPLPIFDRNRGDIAAARADLTAADARLTAARLDANAQWRTAAAQVAATNSRLSASDQGEASAREAYRLARIGYDAGRTPLFELLGTRRSLTEAQLRAVDARLARVRAQATLSRLAGRIPYVE